MGFFITEFLFIFHAFILYGIILYGIKGGLYEWINSWLTRRQQIVQIDGYSSDWKNVTSGVPHGSVIGRPLFVLCINDLPDKLAKHIKFYADDIKIIAIIKEEVNSLRFQNDIDEAIKWSHICLMPFNIDKSKVLHVARTTKRSTSRNTMADEQEIRKEIEVTRVERDLGVQVSDDLKVRNQVDTAAAIANRALGRLKKCFSSRSLPVRRVLYREYIRLHLEYAVQARVPHLQRCQHTRKNISTNDEDNFFNQTSLLRGKVTHTQHHTSSNKKRARLSH